jgi:hypothetical protein
VSVWLAVSNLAVLGDPDEPDKAGPWQRAVSGHAVRAVAGLGVLIGGVTSRRMSGRVVCRPVHLRFTTQWGRGHTPFRDAGRRTPDGKTAVSFLSRACSLPTVSCRACLPGAHSAPVFNAARVASRRCGLTGRHEMVDACYRLARLRRLPVNGSAGSDHDGYGAYAVEELPTCVENVPCPEIGARFPPPSPRSRVVRVWAARREQPGIVVRGTGRACELRWFGR